MRIPLFFIIILVITPLMFSCSKPDLARYQDETPVFNLFDYFEGDTTGWGMVQDRSGNLIRRFVVRIDGTFDPENNLILEEYFDWSDGEKSTRVWTIKKSGDNTFTGTADDVVGKAVGSAYGNVLNWQYHLNIEVDGRTWKVHLDDWLYLQQDNVLINKTKMSKFGIRLGDITIVFRKDTERG